MTTKRCGAWKQKGCGCDGGWWKGQETGCGAQAEVTVFINDGAVGRSGSGAPIAIDDCNFHSCAQPDRLAEERVLVATPPRGESVLMNHRAFFIEALPFRVCPFVDEPSTTKTVATVKVHADIPPERHAVNVAVLVHVSRSCASCFSESTARHSSVQHNRAQRRVQAPAHPGRQRLCHPHQHDTRQAAPPGKARSRPRRACL